MSPPRPPLRLVGGRDHRPGDDGGDEPDFEPLDRAPHDLHLHQPYRELAAVDGDDENAEADGEAPDAEPSRPGLSPRFAISALAAFQLLGALSYLPKYIALAKGGTEEFVFAAVLSVPASLCLYAGTLLMALRPGRGRVLFLVAAVGLALAVAGWGVSWIWTWPIAFGAMLGVAGAWFARTEVLQDEASGPQP